MVLGGCSNLDPNSLRNCRLVADEKLSQPDAKEPGDQAATAEYFCSFLSPPLPSPPPSPSSIPVSIPHSATHLRRSSRFRGWLSSTAVAQRSCLTVQLRGKKTKQKKTACFWKASRRVQELLEGLRQSVVLPCHSRCLLMTWQRCHYSKVTRANLGYFRREARRKLFCFFFSPLR